MDHLRTYVLVIHQKNRLSFQSPSYTGKSGTLHY